MTNLCNPDVELYLIAAAMKSPSRWHEVNFVKPEDFSDPLNCRVWEEIANLILAGRSPVAHVIAGEIYPSAEDQKSLSKHLTDWEMSLPLISAGPEYASVVKDLADRRKLLKSANEIALLAENTSCGLNAAEIASQGVNAMMGSQMDCLDFVPAHEIGESVIANLDKKVPVSATGFERLDKAMGGGFYQGRFYGLGARMKSGKSLFMSTLAYNMAINNGARILYLCLEMGSEESLQRILSMHMGINSLDFLKPDIRSKEWFRKRTREANDALKNTKLYFRSKPRMTLDDLKATVARAGMSGKVDGVIVDYLQLVEGKPHGQSTAEHYDNVAQTLAEAVKRHPMWILSAAQLNKEGAIRGSEGLLMACDLAFSINKKEGSIITNHEGKDQKCPDQAWLETMVSRYTPYRDIGSEVSPGYEISLERGPSFVELDA